MAIISINDMRIYAHHGCFAEERTIGTWFRADVRFEYDAAEAAATDDISLAVNYLDVYKVVAREMGRPSRLIEAVALRVKKALENEFPRMRSVTVRIAKINPPLGGEVGSVSVEL